MRKSGGCHWEKGCIEIPERGEILGNLENMITMRWDREPLQKGLTNVLKNLLKAKVQTRQETK